MKNTIYCLIGVTTVVPVPAASILFISGLLGVIGFSKRRSI